jgi:hypothetical protein
MHVRMNGGVMSPEKTGAADVKLVCWNLQMGQSSRVLQFS